MSSINNSLIGWTDAQDFLSSLHPNLNQRVMPGGISGGSSNVQLSDNTSGQKSRAHGGSLISRSSLQPSNPTSLPSYSSSKELRATFLPNWAVSPKVLLMAEDAASRKFCSKILQVFGCTIDVAVDGVGAVKSLTLQNYDLFLMVCRLFIHKSSQQMLSLFRTSLCPNLMVTLSFQ